MQNVMIAMVAVIAIETTSTRTIFTSFLLFASSARCAGMHILVCLCLQNGQEVHKAKKIRQNMSELGYANTNTHIPYCTYNIPTSNILEIRVEKDFPFHLFFSCRIYYKIHKCILNTLLNLLSQAMHIA